MIVRPKQRAKDAMRVDKIKEHIHRELFGNRFSVKPPIMEWKEQCKQEVMRLSVNVMLRHDLSEKDIVQMLKDKFFLTEEQAHEFMKNNFPKTEEGKEGNFPCQY